MMLKPFKRDPSEPYDEFSERKAFFTDFWELGRMRIQADPSGCRGITSKYAPKPIFLKQRAMSLHRSGISPAEISRMLQISKNTAYIWLSDEYREKSTIRRAVKRAEQLSVTRREAASSLPTLPFVPHIELTKNSKYRMEDAHVGR